MLRKTLLAALAATTLAGCATGYSYRGGSGGGDYYYGQPRIEYRYYEDPFGYYGSFGFGRYAPAYYYDRYGRLVYGGSYGYYGYPYGYGSQWWYRPRPHGNGHGHGGGGHDNGNDHGDHDADRDDRRPPWRNIGGVYPRGERVAPDGAEPQPRVRRQQAPGAMPTPPRQQAEQRVITPAPPPRMRSDNGGGSRMGRAIRNVTPSATSED
jgi:hypothetical protein